MNKENVLFGIIGLLLGLIIGFVFANKYNQDQSQPRVTTQSNPTISTTANPQEGHTGSNGQGGMMPEVAQAIEKAKNEPNNFDAQMQAASIYYRIQQFDKAIEHFQQANKIKPDNYDAIVWLGNSNFDAHRYEIAGRWYTDALVKNPDDIAVRTDLGLTFMFRTPPDYDRAIKEFEGSLQRDLNHKQTLQNIASAYIQKRDGLKAKEYLDRLEKIDPNNEAIVSMRQKIQSL